MATWTVPILINFNGVEIGAALITVDFLFESQDCEKRPLAFSPFGSAPKEGGTELQRAPNAASAPVLLAERDQRRE